MASHQTDNQSMADEQGGCRPLIESMPVGVMIFDPKGGIIQCNPTAARFLGLPKEGIEGSSASQVSPHFFHEDGRSLEADDFPFMKVLSSGLRLDNFVMGVNLDRPEIRCWILTHTYPEFDRLNCLQRVVMVMINILKRKEIESKLEEEEAFARALMENLPDSIYFKDKDSRFIRINQAEASLLGVENPEAALGKTDFNFFSEAHARVAFQDEQDIILSGKSVIAKEERLTFPDGRVAWVSTTKMPLADLNGNIIGTFGISYDITRRKKAEMDLVESEHRFRTLFEGAAVGVAMMETKTGKFLRVNRRYCEMLGYSEEELMKLSFTDITESHDIQSNIDHMNMLINGQVRDYSVEKRYVRKDGSIVYAQVSVSPMWEPGEEPTTHITVAQDITERKNAEEAERASRVFLKNLVDHANAPIITWNPAYNITLINHACEKLTGFASDEILGKPLEMLFPEESREKSMKAAARTMNGEQLEGVELPLLHQNGSIRLVEWNTSNLYAEDGKTLLATIAHGKDITDRYNAEQSLLQHTFELELAHDYSSSLRKARTIEEELFVFVENVTSMLSISSGVVFLDDGVPNTLHQAIGLGWLPKTTPKNLSASRGIVAKVYASQKPVEMEGFYPDPIEMITDSSIGLDLGGVCIPMVSDGEMIGLAFFASVSDGRFHEQEIRLMDILAEITTSAVKRTRLRNQIENSNKELKLGDAQRQKIQDQLAEEKEVLSITLMSIGDALIRVDQDGIINLFNKSAEEITGYSASEAMGKPYEQVFKLLDYDTNQPMVNTIKKLLVLDQMEKDNPDYRVLTLITKTGKRTLVSGTVSRLLMTGEVAPGYVLAFRDVSEKYNREAQTALSQKMEAIGQLAAGIAHEINTPIQYIGDNMNFLQRTFARFSEILKTYHECLENHYGKTVTPEEVAEMEALLQEKKISRYLSEVPSAILESQDGIDRVRKIVVAIREFSHASDQEMKMADINRAIATTITISRNEWKYVADMETNLDPDLPQVYCQIDEINQVVLNMIVNAAQAIQPVIDRQPGGKGKIIVTTGSQDKKVYIKIEDTGTGIPESIRDRIFDPFFTTKEVGKGTGQGLALAHNIIIKKHHGRIFVDSEPGKGTTFTIELQIGNPMEEVE